MKRQIEFKDKNSKLVKIEIKIKEGRLSICGETCGSAGQCQDSIIPKNSAQEKLLEIWNTWHLNDLHAGTERQEKALKKIKGDYSEQVKYLKSINLYDDNGYKYGTGWLKRELPEGIEDKINDLCDKIAETEEREKKNLVSILWEDIEDNNIIALGQSLNITPAEARKYISGGNNDYQYAGIYYFVGSQKEAEERAIEYLTDDPYIWQETVKAGKTTLGLYDWVKEVINIDGLGHILNSWDSSEDYVFVNENQYFICRR